MTAEAIKLAGRGGTRIDLLKAAEYLQRAAAIIRAGIQISANNDRHLTNFRVQVFHRGLMGEKLTSRFAKSFGSKPRLLLKWTL